MNTEQFTDEEILKKLSNYIDNVDDLDISKEDKSWRTNGFATGVIIGLLLEIRKKVKENGDL